MKFEINISSKQGIIAYDFAKLESDLKDELKKFRGLVVTEETIVEHKDVRAKLNKIEKLIEDERKRIKKEYSEPLTIFEKEVKKLTGMISDVSSEIDVQLKKFDQEEKDAKLSRIENYILQKQSEINLPFEVNVNQNPRWLNKAYREEDWQSDVDNQFNKVKGDYYELLSSNGTEKDREALLTIFMLHQDAKKAREEFSRAQEAISSIKVNIPEKEESLTIGSYEDDTANLGDDDEIVMVRLEVTATKKQIERLQRYLDEFENAVDWSITKG